MFSKKIIPSVIQNTMKKFSYFLLLFLFAIPLKTYAQPFVDFIAQTDAASIDCNTSTIVVDIAVKDHIEMNSWDYSFHWDETVVSLTNVENLQVLPSIAINNNSSAFGILTFSWFSFGGSTTIPDGAIVRLTFDVIGNAGQSSNFFFDGMPTFVNIAQYGSLINDTQYTFVSASVALTDTENPTITCPANITADTNGGTITQVSGATPTTTDNCGIETLTYSLSNATTGSGTGDVSNNVAFNVGTTTVEYTATDFGGNTATCSFDVVVTNNSGPSILTIYLDQLTLNCDNTTASVNVYADLFENMTGSQFSIQWDNNLLQYIDTTNINTDLVGFLAFNASQLANGQIGFSWGNSTGVTLPAGSILFTLNFDINFPVGTTVPVDLFDNPVFPNVFTNTMGPIASTNFQLIDGFVNLDDSADPVLTCPMDVSVNSANGIDAVVNGIAPTSTDDCGIMSTTYTLTNGGSLIGSGNDDASGSTFPSGVTTVEYTVTDFGGNAVSCRFDVTVETPGALTIKIDSVLASCDGNPITIGFPVKNFNNINGVQFTVRWDETELELLPNFVENLTPPQNAFGQPAPGTLNYSWFSNSAVSLMDDEDVIVLQFNVLNTTPGGSYDITFQQDSPLPFLVLSGQSTVPALAIDGNIFVVDNTAPMITCPADVTVDGNGVPNVVVNNLAATASDNCSTPTISYVIMDTTPVTGTGDASGYAFPIGTTQVTYTATDDAGNNVDCSFNVTVTGAPLTIACPANVTQNSDVGICGAALGDLPVDIQSDNNNVASITYELTNATTGMGTGNLMAMTFNVGTTTVTYTVTDIFGNTETCSFTVVISDNEGPVLSGVPADVTVDCDAIPNAATVTANDNCDGILTPTFNETGTTTITRTWTATDAAGNGTIMAQIITVADLSPPTITCPANITVNADAMMAGDCGANVLWTVPTVMDNCDPNPQSTSTAASGSFFGIGTETVKYFVIDNAGNLDSCEFTVTVVDSEAPVLTDCPMDIVVQVNGNICSASVLWNPPTVMDNCDNNVLLESNFQPGNNIGIGTITVVYTATDASGNVSMCSFNVTVMDTVSPNIACPADMTVSTNGDVTDPNNFLTSVTPFGCDSVILTFGTPFVADNCGVPTVAQTAGLISNDTFPLGANTIEFTVTDGSGNTNTCQATITVTPFLALTTVANPDSICVGGSASLSVNQIAGANTPTWTGPDGTSYTGTTIMLTNLTMADSGTFIVMVTEPVSGCVSSASVELVVQDGPSIEISADQNPLLCTDGTQDIMLTANNLGTGGISSFEWFNPAGTSIGNQQTVIISAATAAASGSYSVIVEGENGCTSTTAMMVNITDAITQLPSINSVCESAICAGEPCSLIGFFGNPDSVIWSATGSGGDPGLPADVTTNEIIITPSQNGIYNYTYTVYKDGCPASASVPIIVSSPANVESDSFNVEFNTALIDFDVTENDSVPGSLPGVFTINVTSDVKNGTLVNNGDGTFSYSPNDGFIGEDQFIYEICLECADQTICRFAFAKLQIVSEECLIPSVISPNGDDFNDTWEISCVRDNPDNELIVYNRWGDEVYRASPYNNDWEGTFDNEDLPDGVYFYIFKKNASDQDAEKGTINIFR